MELNESFNLNQVITGFMDLIRGNISISDITKPSKRKIEDLNKAASANALDIYALVSSNVDPDIYKRLSSGLQTKIATLINIIAESYVGGQGEEVIDFIKNNLSNSDHILDILPDDVKASIFNEGAALGNFLLEVDKLYEGGVTISAPSLTESKGTTSKARTSKAKTKSNSSMTTNKSGDKFGSNMKHQSFLTDKNSAVFMSPGNIYTFDVRAFNKDKSPITFTYSILVRVNLIEVEADKITDAIVDTNNRNTWFQYLRYRAGRTSLLNGVLLNMRTIERDIKLATSDNITDRILRSLSSKGGFYSPKAFDFGKIDEFKKFIIVLDTSDVDTLSNQNFVLTRAAALKVAFRNLNMLSLCIVDGSKKRMSIIDSDRPTEMQVISTKDLDNTKKLTELFSKLA